MAKRDQEEVRAPALPDQASVRALPPDGQRCACDETGAAGALAQARAWAMRMQASRRELVAENDRLRASLDAAAERLEDIDSALWTILQDLHQAIEADEDPGEKVLEAIETVDGLFDVALAQIDEARAGAAVPPAKKGP